LGTEEGDVNLQGTLQYLDEPGYLAVRRLIVSGDRLMFEMESVTPELGAWSIEGTAQRNGGFYSVSGPRTVRNNVQGPPVDLTFKISPLSDGTTYLVSGTWNDSDGFTKFEGELQLGAAEPD
jgi:hypothetical protein